MDQFAVKELFDLPCPVARLLDLPRVLWIADEIPQSAYAGGILLKRLFSGYPVERLLVVGHSSHPEAELLPVRYERLTLRWRRLTHTRFARIARSLHVLGLMPTFAPPLERLVGEFQPEVVVTLMQHFAYYQAAARFARSRGLPLVALVHDLPGQFDQVYLFAKRTLEARIGAIYRQSERRLCISPEMVACLESKYGVPGEVLYPNRSEAIVPRPLEHSRSWRNPHVFTLGYAGSLSYGYGETLERLCTALPVGSIRLHYFGRNDQMWLGRFPSDVLVRRGFATAETTWQRVQQECDAVILAYSFDERYRALYSTHFPSKLPEYLALRMPVVVLGPPFATGVRWALRNPNAAVCITEPQPAAWVVALRKLTESADQRLTLADAAYSAGERDFSPSKLKTQFLVSLSESRR